MPRRAVVQRAPADHGRRGCLHLGRRLKGEVMSKHTPQAFFQPPLVALVDAQLGAMGPRQRVMTLKIERGRAGLIVKEERRRAASAPELLERAEATVSAYGCTCVDGEERGHCPLCQLRDAIAHARGK